MKFTINKHTFLNYLQIVSKAMASKTNMPAYTGILVTCEKDSIELVASNTEFAIKATVEDVTLKVESEGKFLVPGRFFCDIVRKLNGEFIDIELEEDNILRIQSGSSDITLNLLDVEDYPEISFDQSVEPITMDTELLKEIAKETTFAASVVDTKPILMGVNFRISENKLLAVSTDSFRLSKRLAVLDDKYHDTNIIIPAKSFNEAIKTIGDSCDTVQIYFHSSKAIFKAENVLFQTRLLDGNYPDTSKLIPTSFPVVLKFDKEDLISAIDRVSTLSANSSATTVVKLQIDESGIINLASNLPELGTIKDTIEPIEIVSMSPITISFSASYFLDAVRAFSSNQVYVKFTGEIRPFIFEAEKDEGLIELVLPMKSE